MATSSAGKFSIGRLRLPWRESRTLRRRGQSPRSRGGFAAAGPGNVRMLVRPPTSILLLALVAVPALVAACAVERDAGAPLQAAHDPSPAADGRLTARPRRVVRPARRGRMR